MLKKRAMAQSRWANEQDEVLSRIAKQMSDKIDQEIMWDLLKQSGWTQVTIDRFQDSRHAVDITCWLEDHAKHSFKHMGRDFIFEDAKDATLFILKWV
jgi:hypothetical protein